MTVMLTAVLVAIFAVAFFVVYISDQSAQKRDKPSPSKFGAGAFHPRRSLPPITRCVTSVPTGSSDPSYWQSAHTLRNREPQH